MAMIGLAEATGSRLREAARRHGKRLRYFGLARHCVICHADARCFLTTRKGRPDAICPICGSLERHRLIWTWIRQRSGLTAIQPPRTTRLLHVAPERHLETKLRALPGVDYLSGDLERRAMRRLDVTNLPFDDATFDVVLCNHVLEHVPEDRRAMRELRRVLRPSGWASLLVPITAGPTFEDPSVTSEAERHRLFGQYDHVRRYGPDYVDRLAEAGFAVETLTAVELMSTPRRRRAGLMDDETLHIGWAA